MRFQCPFCRGVVAAENKQMGEEVQCGHCDEVVSVPNSRLATGAVVGDFALLEELGRGGMGVVYLAHQISLDRPAALKILQDTYANNAEFVVNFIKEARSAAKLNHPHIVQAYAVGEDEGIFYYAMEYIDGDTMKDVLKRDKVIPIDKAVTIVQQIAEALDCAWKEEKLIHRDIKPDNIILAKNNRAKLADLGLSRVAGDIEDEGDEIMGTPQYISPEHLTGAPMDVRSDIYSLGATFYQFVTGRFPYEGRNANEIARKHLEATLVAPQLVNPDVPEAIGQIIMKMMKKNINERYQNAEELVEDLRLFRRGKLSTTGTAPKVFSPASVPKVKKGESGDDKSQPLEMDMPTTTTGGLEPLFTASNTAATSAILFTDELESSLKKPKKKLIMYSIIMITVIIIVGALLVWFYILPMGQAAVQVETPAIPLPTQRTFRQEYINGINEILADFDSKKYDKKTFLARADVLLKEFPQALSGKERKKYELLMSVYVPIDEKERVLPARKKLRDEHLALIAERERRAKELKLEAERKAKEEMARRIRLAKEAAEREKRLIEEKRLAEIKKQQIEKRTAAYRKTIEQKKAMLSYNFVEYAMANKVAEAEKIFAEALKEPQKASKLSSAEKRLANSLADYASQLRKSFLKGRQAMKAFLDNRDKLVGLGIEYARYKYGHISKIENSHIYVKMADDSIVKLKLSDMNSAYLHIYYKKAIKRLKISDQYFYFLLFNGLFDKGIEKFAPDQFWKSELEDFEKDYFKIKLEKSTRDEQNVLKRRFGRLEAFRKALTN
jgi:serine/threonine protein kinase/Tfp pilus assembly protein PilP